MKLEEMTFARLLALYNSISAKQAGPKTFASRARLIERITKTAKAQDITLDAIRQAKADEADKLQSRTSKSPAELNYALPEKTSKRGNGVGELARRLLLNPKGYPYSKIATLVNEKIPGSAATDKSVRWYASKMRKAGISVPARQDIRDDHIWISDQKTARECLQGVQVVKPAPSE